MCRINYDGTTWYDWDVVKEEAAKWVPGEDTKKVAVIIAKLLLPLKESIDRVRELHFDDTNSSTTNTRICYTCDLVMPCPTLRALDGNA